MIIFDDKILHLFDGLQIITRTEYKVGPCVFRTDTVIFRKHSTGNKQDIFILQLLTNLSNGGFNQTNINILIVCINIQATLPISPQVKSVFRSGSNPSIILTCIPSEICFNSILFRIYSSTYIQSVSSIGYLPYRHFIICYHYMWRLRSVNFIITPKSYSCRSPNFEPFSSRFPLNSRC